MFLYQSYSTKIPKHFFQWISCWFFDPFFDRWQLFFWKYLFWMVRRRRSWRHSGGRRVAFYSSLQQTLQNSMQNIGSRKPLSESTTFEGGGSGSPTERVIHWDFLVSKHLIQEEINMNEVRIGELSALEGTAILLVELLEWGD